MHRLYNKVNRCNVDGIIGSTKVGPCIIMVIFIEHLVTTAPPLPHTHAPDL